MNTGEISCLFVNYVDGVSNVAVSSFSPFVRFCSFIRAKPAGYIALVGREQVFRRVRKSAKSDY